MKTLKIDNWIIVDGVNLHVSTDGNELLVYDGNLEEWTIKGDYKKICNGKNATDYIPEIENFVKAYGFFWGNHPHSNGIEESGLDLSDFGKWYYEKWRKIYEARTFNPNQTMIFEKQTHKPNISRVRLNEGI